MVERELILRFFALHDTLPDYRTPLVRYLNNYMRAHRNGSAEWLEEKRLLFQRTLQLINEAIAGSAFRVTDKNGTPTEKSINRALFEAQAVAFSVIDDSSLAARTSEVRSNVFELCLATGDRTRTLYRIDAVLRALERSGVVVRRSHLGAVSWPAPKTR